MSTFGVVSFFRQQKDIAWTSMPVLDTCTEKTAIYCVKFRGRGGKFKLPNLTELHKHLFGEGFGEAHNATADVEANNTLFFRTFENWSV